MKYSFLLGIKTEWLKYRHTSLFGLTLLIASLTPIMKIISCMVSDELYGMMMHRDSWHFFLMINWKDTAAVMLPMYVILLNNSIAQTEYRNNAWKQLYALPRSYADIFFSKFIVVQVMIIFYFLCFNLFCLIAAVLLFLLKGVHNFFQLPIPWYQMLIISIRVYIGILAVSAIQYWLSVRFRNFMIPLGIGLSLLIGCLLLGGWVKNHLYSPYLFPLFMFSMDHSNEHYSLGLMYMVSLVSFVLSLLSGFLNLYFRKEKG
ncbi:ABC transporter permease subunit [Chitinophaga oryziterrae]|uniref:ABC transporter permease subunit n=1 Tax=Chitinophaga oryziterrae TaxID=1031224 RepID=A0A6N8JE54_9BACT|nr:ABC transporter permease [Chitinophaga oryziterrae]MVT42402.1 ABC transporter permease subunit [Chitinophaga oryziterrae]